MAEWRDVKPAYSDGKRVRRRSWPRGWYIQRNQPDNADVRDCDEADLAADDWTVSPSWDRRHLREAE